MNLLLSFFLGLSLAVAPITPIDYVQPIDPQTIQPGSLTSQQITSVNNFIESHTSDSFFMYYPVEGGFNGKVLIFLCSSFNSSHTTAYNSLLNLIIEPNGSTSSGGNANWGTSDLVGTQSHVFYVCDSGITITNLNNLLSLPLSSSVPVTGVTLDTTRLTLNVGETHQFVATVSPSDATVSSVTWINNNPSIGTLNNGLFTATSSGVGSITVRTTDGNYMAVCNITVNSTDIDNPPVDPPDNPPVDPPYNPPSGNIPTQPDIVTGTGNITDVFNEWHDISKLYYSVTTQTEISPYIVLSAFDTSHTVSGTIDLGDYYICPPPAYDDQVACLFSGTANVIKNSSGQYMYDFNVIRTNTTIADTSLFSPSDFGLTQHDLTARGFRSVGASDIQGVFDRNGNIYFYPYIYAKDTQINMSVPSLTISSRVEYYRSSVYYLDLYFHSIDPWKSSHLYMFDSNDFIMSNFGLYNSVNVIDGGFYMPTFDGYYLYSDSNHLTLKFLGRLSEFTSGNGTWIPNITQAKYFTSYQKLSLANYLHEQFAWLGSVIWNKPITLNGDININNGDINNVANDYNIDIDADIFDNLHLLNDVWVDLDLNTQLDNSIPDSVLTQVTTTGNLFSTTVQTLYESPLKPFILLPIIFGVIGILL